MITPNSQNLHKNRNIFLHIPLFFIKNTKLLQVSVSNVYINYLFICLLSYMAVLCHMYDKSVTIYTNHQFRVIFYRSAAVHNLNNVTEMISAKFARYLFLFNDFLEINECMFFISLFLAQHTPYYYKPILIVFLFYMTIIIISGNTFPN